MLNVNMNNLPSVAMMYDGIFFEEEIEGYKTIRVNGRESNVMDYTKEVVPFGELITNQNVTSRMLLIEFMITAENTNEFQNKIKNLTKLLYKTEDQTIAFADDPNTIFYGRFESFLDFTDYKNAVVGSFTIYCQDPLKYGPTIETSGEVTIDTTYETVPEEILVTPSSAIDHLEITNGTYTIRLDGNISLGHEVKILFKEQEIYVNGVISTYMFALNSDFENFQIQQGETITSSNGSLILKARERWL